MAISSIEATVSQFLPPEAREMLVRASKVSPGRDGMSRSIEIDRVVRLIRAKYPDFFKDEPCSTDSLRSMSAESP